MTIDWSRACLECPARSAREQRYSASSSVSRNSICTFRFRIQIPLSFGEPVNLQHAHTRHADHAAERCAEDKIYKFTHSWIPFCDRRAAHGMAVYFGIVLFTGY